MDEKEWIEQTRRGDEHAFEALVARYEKKVYSLCLRICGNVEDAQEAAQDAFLSVWRSIGAYRGDAAFSTWLYRLATNACIDLLRRNRRDAVSLEDDGLALTLPDPQPQPEEWSERREQRQLIESALSALPAEYRTALVLRELEGLSYAEIAETTRQELGTVKSRISRGRRLVQNYLTANGNFFPRRASKEAKNAAAGKEADGI